MECAVDETAPQAAELPEYLGHALLMPGGHVDPGETTIDAAAREVHEETGLEVDSLELLCMWESGFRPGWTLVHSGATRLCWCTVHG